ncbi:Nuclear pore complex protein NUP107 [Camellia lanceoleosa]|uniref:Nuclear pore complex protein NUP107 n=1 Tax=Camellia lanceoleosa TaxID=1840588 RepID=A0ACC0IHA4_9ERIC|nr:Nuclear pore complex protein NUP107 [Camellia lanceoleosa]
MEVDKETSPSYFDPEDLSTRERYRRYGKRHSTSSHGSSVSFSGTRILYDGQSIERRPNAALFLEDIKQEVESFDADQLEGTPSKTQSALWRKSLAGSCGVSEADVAADSIRRPGSYSLKSCKHEDAALSDGGADVPPTVQSTGTVVALPSQQPSSSRPGKRARTSRTEQRLADEDETILPLSPAPSPQRNAQPEHSDRAAPSKWVPNFTFQSRDILESDSVVAEKDHLMAFNLAKSVCLPKDMEHHQKQLNTELKAIRSSTKSMILAIQKNNITHRKVLELRRNTREAMREAEAKTAELEEARKQLAELRSENGRLTGLVSSADAEKQRVAIELKDKYLRELAKIEKKKNTEITQLKESIKGAEKQGFKKAEDAYTQQCEAAKDLFFKCGWRSAVEQLGSGPKTEVYNAPQYFIPASLAQYAADLQKQFLEASDDDDEDEDKPTDTPASTSKPPINQLG